MLIDFSEPLTIHWYFSLHHRVAKEIRRIGGMCYANQSKEEREMVSEMLYWLSRKEIWNREEKRYLDNHEKLY